jgi:membrane protease YdiL (CAAX protease family)
VRTYPFLTKISVKLVNPEIFKEKDRAGVYRVSQSRGNRFKRWRTSYRWIELRSTGGTRRALLGVALAVALWSFTFLTSYFGSFWIRVTLSALILALYATFSDRGLISEAAQDFRIGELVKGVVMGASLYAMFYLGFSVLRSFLEVGASNVYLFRLESPTAFIAYSLVLTSFCEEYFWRAYIQRNLVSGYGAKNGVLATSLAYALIHAPTMNAPLVLAAFIAGLFWGILYRRTGSLWLVVASHLVWTELIFVFLPLG